MSCLRNWKQGKETGWYGQFHLSSQDTFRTASPLSPEGAPPIDPLKLPSLFLPCSLMHELLCLSGIRCFQNFARLIFFFFYFEIVASRRGFFWPPDPSWRPLPSHSLLRSCVISFMAPMTSWNFLSLLIYCLSSLLVYKLYLQEQGCCLFSLPQ